jgi:uncharacterized protein (DUF4415 family)
MSKPDPKAPDDDVPELGDEFFARAKPAAAVMPESFMTAVRRKAGRPPKEDAKAPVSLRLDPAILRHLRGRGSGWQTAVNDALADLIKRGRL